MALVPSRLYLARPMPSAMTRRPPAVIRDASRRLPIVVRAVASGSGDGDGDGPDEEEEAKRILGLGPNDRDLIAYLRAGRTLLAKRVAIVLPADNDVLYECLLSAAEKFVRLGASVEVLTDRSVSGSSQVPWSASVPFPRCVVRPLNLTSVAEVAGALEGVSALVLSPVHLPDQGAETFAAALPLAGATAPPPGADAARDDEAAAGLAASPAGVQQLVVLSSVEVYASSLVASGTTGPITEEAAQPHLGGGSTAGTGGGGVDEGGGARERCAAVEREELLVGSCGGRAAVLRACPLFGDDGAAAAEMDSLFSDALGLQELVDDYVDDLEGLSAMRAIAARGDDDEGGGDSGRDGDGGRESRAASLASLLPPASMRVQLTHTLDFSGASIFAVVAGLDGAYHVCAAPLTLQELFDRLARRKDWERIALRQPADGEASAAAEGADAAFFSAAKLEREGFGLMWPDLTSDDPELGAFLLAPDDVGAVATEESGVVTSSARGGGAPAASGEGGEEPEEEEEAAS